MVNKRNWFGMLTLIIGVMLVFSLIACSNGSTGGGSGGGGGGGGNVEKTLVITNVPANLYTYGLEGGNLGVFPVGITPQQALNWTGVVAGAYLDNDDIVVSGSRLCQNF